MYQNGEDAMSEEEIKFPDVNYGDNNKDKYQELTFEDWSPFKDHAYWEIFIFSMSYGFAKNLEPIEPTGKGTINAKVLAPPVRHLMRALAIKDTGNISVIKDSAKVARICEKYANAGFQEVYARIKNRPSEKPIEEIFSDMISEINRNNAI